MASSLAHGFTAESKNRDGNAYIVVDDTPLAEPGAVDRAPPAVATYGPTKGEFVASGVALATSGTRLGAGVGAGLLIDLATAPKTYDSRLRSYRVVYEKSCKVSFGLSSTNETDVSLLVPGRPARWIEPPSGKGFPVLTALLDDQQKALPPIDDKHPCFAKWAEAVQKYTKSADAGR